MSEVPRQPCARGCLSRHRHLDTCPADNGTDGAWIPATIDLPDGTTVYIDDTTIDQMFDADHRHTIAAWTFPAEHGGFEQWVACTGCRPRIATHGHMCDTCHGRLATLLGGVTTVDSLAWAYDHLAPELAPGREGTTETGRQRNGEKTRPLPLTAGVYDLRAELAATLDGWLLRVTERFGLHGPDWWARRGAGRGRKRLERGGQVGPRSRREIADAAGYLRAWTDTICGDVDTVNVLLAEGGDVLAKVRQVAPWRPRAQRVPEVHCPECDCEALVLYQGQDVLTCRRCRAKVKRSRFDHMTTLVEYERAVAS